MKEDGQVCAVYSVASLQGQIHSVFPASLEMSGCGVGRVSPAGEGSRHFQLCPFSLAAPIFPPGHRLGLQLSGDLRDAGRYLVCVIDF